MNHTNRNANLDAGVAVMVTMSLLCLQCVSADSRAPQTSFDVVYFHVSSACTSDKLGGVTVSMIDYNGELVGLGESTEGGLVVVGRPRLEGAQLIMFCADDYFCTAIKKPAVSAETQITILLAPFAIT